MSESCSTRYRDEFCVKIVVGKLQGERHLVDPGVDWKTTFKWILKGH